MKIAIGCDHAGFEAKEELKKYLQDKGFIVDDKGCFSTDSVHYPVYGKAVAEAVQKGEAERGILICGTGIGMSLVANKFDGIRAALCHNDFTAEASREHNNANILVVSENGFGKRSAIEDYRITNRGGKGVKTINMTEKTGNLIALIDVTDEDNLMIINRSGLTIRLEVSSLRVMGRNTQGVKLINLRNEDSIAAVAKVSAAKEEENSEVVAEEERGEAEPNGQSEENV